MGDPIKTIEPTDPEATASAFQITQFTDDSALLSASLPMYCAPADIILAPGTEARQHTIEDIMCRPTIIAEGVWAAEIAGSTLKTLKFPDAILSRNENMRDKIKFWTYFRADVVIRIMVNATPYQKGKLLAYFAPFSDDVGTRSSFNNHLSARTAFPHVIMDASTGNSGQLTIPYVSPFNHYNLIIPNGDMGTLKLDVLNALAPANCNFTITAQFANVDLSVPTAAPRPVGFNGLSTESKVLFSKLVKDGTIKVQDDAAMSDLGYRAQVAEDINKSKQGIVSSTLDGIASVSSALSNVPILSSVLKPVSWLASTASGVASAAGYNKPGSVNTQEKFQQVPAFGYTHSEGLDQSTVLGTIPNNQLVPRGDMFGSSVDEMDINYIISRYTLLKSFVWSKDSAIGTKIFTMPVHPGLSNISGTSLQPTLLAFVSSMFQKWRGGMSFKIQLAKTSFHSGKVRIAFVPSGNLAAVIAGTYDLSTCHNIIADFRTSDELEFNIPFTSAIPWRRVALLDVSSVTDSDIFTGILVMEVLNPLVAIGTVSSAVDVNVWVKGNSDMSFAIPDFSKYKVTSGLVANSSIDEGYKAQVLGAFQDAGFNQFSDAPDLFKMNALGDTLPEEIAMGEKITNLRQLIHRFGERNTFTPNKNYALLKVGTAYFGTENEDHPIPLDYISWLYRFFRGSTRHKIFVEPIRVYEDFETTYTTRNPLAYPLIQANHQISKTPTPVTYSSELSDTVPFNLLEGAQYSAVQPSALNPFLEITTPQYLNVAMAPIMATDATGFTDIDFNRLHVAVNSPWINGGVAGEFSPSTWVKLSHLVAAGDDFSFGWLVGPPTLTPIT